MKTYCDASCSLHELSKEENKMNRYIIEYIAPFFFGPVTGCVYGTSEEDAISRIDDCITVLAIKAFN